MTESEICRMFRGCANRKEQISIIRDLSLKTKNQIFKILLSNGAITEQDSDFDTLNKFCKPTAKELEQSKKVQGNISNKVKAEQKIGKKAVREKPKAEEKFKVEEKIKTEEKIKKKPKVVSKDNGYSKNKSLEVVNETPVEKLGIIDISEANNKPTHSLSREAIVSYTIFQRKHGVNIDTIARDLGITRDDAVAICAEHIDEIGDTLIIDENNKRYIKDTLIKIDNYMSYIESFVKTDNIEGIAKVVDEQRKLLRIAQSLLR